MKIINLHKRSINHPVAEIGRLLSTLASDNDLMLATDKWPPMKLDKGLHVGSKGGHGPIKYFVVDFNPEKSISFQFDLKGFDGTHKFEIVERGPSKTEISHLIDMKTTGAATVKWILAIRWLHDAYIEDAFDKIENHFNPDKKSSEWSVWVKILRKMLASKRNKK